MIKPWWAHESYDVTDADISLDGESLAVLGKKYGTPLYIYSAKTIQRQLRTLQGLLDQAVSRSRIYYAMKSNRHPGVLEAVRGMKGVGLDTCSPREVDLALQSGFLAEDISFNAGMLSNRDFAHLAETGVHCTLDSYSSLRRYADVAKKGQAVGLRFNPGVKASYGGSSKMAYGQSKFGFEPDELKSVLDHCQSLGLMVDTIHMHIGWGITQENQSLVDEAFERLASLAKSVKGLARVNVGGGLGGKYTSADQPLALMEWSGLIKKHFAPLGIEVICEPGTVISAPSGVLLTEVNTVEYRRGTWWVGLDAGFAVNLNAAHYGIALTPVLVKNPLGAPIQPYSLVGNINEAGDIWLRDVPLPEVSEGDLLAWLPAGAYGSSMASDHCLRGRPQEICLHG